MFTGIIARQGRFRGYRQGRSEAAVEAPGFEDKLATGDSIAVNGVCLTLAGRDGSVLRFDLSRETLAKSTLGSLKPGDLLNLELPLTLATPLSGHLVSGHVDGVGTVARISSRPPGRRLTVSFPASLRPFFVPKGSVAVEGVSLTVASLGPSSFEVELIPTTLTATNLGALRAGARVNLECDLVGKYVYNWISQGHKKG
ncbi:MAG: riboflavin synthase [Candidatus Aminicenantales bacterium]